MSYDLIAAKLNEIEAEMHRIGYWNRQSPNARLTGIVT
jgi:hypothetical protein